MKEKNTEAMFATHVEIKSTWVVIEVVNKTIFITFSFEGLF